MKCTGTGTALSGEMKILHKVAVCKIFQNPRYIPNYLFFIFVCVSYPGAWRINRDILSLFGKNELSVCFKVNMNLRDVYISKCKQ